MIKLIPLVKLDTPESFIVLKAEHVDLIVVRLQDLVSESTFKFNDTYEEIVSVGGLHKFLGFNGEILLSLIMKDEIIANFSPKMYAEVINSVKPDKYTTVDGETYEGEAWLASKEIERINLENRELMRLTTEFTPVGLVKGCTTTQIEDHAKKFEALGVNEFIFHVGDFLRNGDRQMIK